jgi:hypothetical protein
LAPSGSQDESYSRTDINRDVESETFNDDLERAPDDLTEADEERITNSEEDVTSNTTFSRPVVNNEIVGAGKRSVGSDRNPRPPKRRARSDRGISDEREATVTSLLELLGLLRPPDNIPDLLNRTAKSLERRLFDNLSNERPVNALGRSSTLLTAKPKRDFVERYNREKEALLRKVKTYVGMATGDDVDMEHIQDGEIWEVIKQVLDGDS